jgi:predicted metal-binding membrane protein
MTSAARERLRVRLPVLLVSGGAWAILAGAPTALPLHLHGGGLHAGALAVNWPVMLAAMMLPLLTAPLRHVRDRSFARRRARAVGLFLAGYAALWLLAGAALLVIALAIGDSGSGLFATVPAVLLAAVWQCSPARQHCVNRGHRHPPLASAGATADLAVFRFGASHGWWCVGSCWGLMLVAILIPAWHLPAMAVASIWLAAERMDGPAVPGWGIPLPGRARRLAAACGGRLLRPLAGARRGFVSRFDISSL